MAMEHVLRALAQATQPAAARLFDPGRYSLKVFGSPSDANPWGWQLAGHHISLNVTVAGGRYVSPTPSLLGSQPASYGTLAPLADDEELGYRFVNSLDEAQRANAVIYHRPPPDLATQIVPRIGEVERPDPVFAPEPDYVLTEDERDILSYVRSSPKGLSARALDKQQFESLTGLVEAFAGRFPSDVAAAHLLQIERAGLENLAFAWAGSTSPGERHYFRIQGPVLLIEHDNTQDNGAHIHSVWRNPVDDFGDDVLAQHYRLHHNPQDPSLITRYGARHRHCGPIGPSGTLIRRGQLELRPGDLLRYRGEPSPDPIVFQVLVVSAVSVRVREVGDDREVPVAVPQPEIVTDRVAEGAGTVKVPEALLDLRDLRGVALRLQLDEDDIPDHDPILGSGAAMAAGQRQKPSCTARAASASSGPRTVTWRWPRANTSRHGSARVRFASSLPVIVMSSVSARP
jgi:hypothetical protein